MINNKISLFLDNVNTLKKVKGTWGSDIFIKCAALTLTMKNKKADADKINHCRDILKNNTSLFSNFRGNNMLTSSVYLSLEENPEEALNKVLNIYTKLKEKFFNSEYLLLAAWVIYNSNNTLDLDLLVNKTREAYDIMKSNHFFLTSSDDYTSTAMLAVSHTDLNNTFLEIEKCFNILKDNGLHGKNDIQALSHILSLGAGSAEEKSSKVITLNNLLKETKFPLKGYSLPLLAIPTFITDDYSSFISQYIDTANFLKSQKGFGLFSMRSDLRNMISAALVSSEYLDLLANPYDNTVIEAANNTALTITLAIQMATTAAIAGATAAAAASASSN